MMRVRLGNLKLMSVMLEGMVALVRLVQPANAISPMLVTLLGMVTLARARHSVNAVSPMLVTLSGMVTSVRSVQSKTPRCRWR